MEGARPAGPADVAPCERLLAQGRRSLMDRRGGVALAADPDPEAPPADSADAVDRLAEWMGVPGHVLLAGTLEGGVAGVAAGHVRDVAGELVGMVDCLYVEPDARGVGIGTALADALVDAFTGLACTAVDALALPGDRETKQRFEAAGFSARLLVLRRRLP